MRIFTLRKSRTRSYESLILNNVEKSLSRDAQTLFRRQIEEINLIQRYLKDKAVNFYRMRRGKSIPSTEFAFPNRSGAVDHLAQVSLQPRGCETEIKCDVWLVHGVFFSLAFSEPPKRALSQGATIRACRIFCNPMECSHSKPTETMRSTSMMGPVLRGLDERGELGTIRTPVDSVELGRFLHKYGDSLPHDYLQLITEADSFVFHGWTFLGTTVGGIPGTRTDIDTLGKIPSSGLPRNFGFRP